MDITSLKSSQQTAGYSVLKSANKQPELVLELLKKSLAGLQRSLNTPVTPVNVSENQSFSDITGTGKIVDIRV